MQAGDPSAPAALIAIVYDELRQRAGHLMERERVGHTLQPTALVHEAFLRLVQQDRVAWQGRAHFCAVASQVMRRILVDHARARRADKRSGAAPLVGVGGLQDGHFSPDRPADVLALDEALRRLAELDPRQAEIVAMRFFGGLSVEEVAVVLGMSKRAVEAEWTMVKAWLRKEMSEG